MNGHVLHMSGVGVRRGQTVLLDAVDWTVAEGERWVVVGPNGAGKTTLLRIAATQLHPTRGTVEVLGERLGRGDVFELRPMIGFASSAVAAQLEDDMRVRDVVVSAAYGYLGTGKEEYSAPDYARARALLGRWGVLRFEDRAFGTLSEGERKRVLIARALMSNPELLLLDEPAAGLDLGAREDLVRRLGTLAKDESAPALVLVTHHVEEIPPRVYARPAAARRQGGGRGAAGAGDDRRPPQHHVRYRAEGGVRRGALVGPSVVTGAARPGSRDGSPAFRGRCNRFIDCTGFGKVHTPVRGRP